MKTYNYSAATLKAKLQQFEENLENNIKAAAAHLFEMNGNEDLLIELEEDELNVGQFESLLNGYSSLEGIDITNEGPTFKIELYDEYETLDFFEEAFTLSDMIGILEVIEGKILELEVLKNADIQNWNKLTNVGKSRLLYELFPNEILPLVEFVQNMCKSIIEDEKINRTTWISKQFSFDNWLRMVNVVNDRIYTYGCKTSDQFSIQLFYDDAAFISIHCLTVYITMKQHPNKEFERTAHWLFDIKNL